MKRAWSLICFCVRFWVLHSVESGTRKRLFSVNILLLVEDIKEDNCIVYKLSPKIAMPRSEKEVVP